MPGTTLNPQADFSWNLGACAVSPALAVLHDRPARQRALAEQPRRDRREPALHAHLRALDLAAAGSNFLKALNSYQEAFPGLAYTNIYTYTDEVVVPNEAIASSSSLHGRRRADRERRDPAGLPADVSEHIGIGTWDNTAYQIAIDALTHPGTG